MQRSSFVRQPARILLVDVSGQFDGEVCRVVQHALDHFFSLACSLGGPSRLPFFGLFALGTYPEALFPLQNTRGNFARIRGAVEELGAYTREMRGSGGDCVTQGVHEATNMFKRQAQHLLQTAGYWAQLEVSVLTCRPPASVVKQVEAATRQVDMDSLKKAQVIYLTNPDRLMLGEDQDVINSQTSMTSEKSGETDVGGMVDCLHVEQDVLSLENLLKTWLQDCGTDSEHLHLMFPGQQCSAPVVIKCDIHERVLSPAQLPGNSHFVVGCDSTCSRPGVSGPGTGTGQAVPIYVLRAVSKLPAHAVCESVLFGLPLVVRATACWKMDWDDLETNNQHFNALCRLLKDKDQVLLAQLEPPAPPHGSGFRYQVPPPEAKGYFLLVAARSGSLLLKSIAVSELMMPCDVTAGDEPPLDSMKLVGAALDQVVGSESYNPLLVTSGLYESLGAQLAKDMSGAATKRKNNKPTAGLQPKESVAPWRGEAPRMVQAKHKSWDTALTDQPSDHKRSRPVSGKDFYGRGPSDFPTEL